jgi:predicted ArsR family transcriptional regulator
MGIFDRIQSEIEEREKREGITPADLLDLSPPLRRLMNRITREGQLSLETAAEHLGESTANARKMLDALVEKGYLHREEQEEGPIYRTRFARRRGRKIPQGIWSALEEKTQG